MFGMCIVECRYAQYGTSIIIIILLLYIVTLFCILSQQDACIPNPCMNNGECVGILSYTCTCSTDYTGVNCETPVTPCMMEPCKNGGSCTAVCEEEYMCHCGPSYTGENCTMEIDPCVGVDCGSGTCVGNGTTVYCICSPSFTGAACGDIIGRWCVYVCP